MMFLFYILFIICPSGSIEDILNFLNSLKTEEEIFISIKECPSNFLIREAISRISDEKYLNELAREGDWYIKYILIPKIKDENILKEIYLKEEDQLVKDEAIRYIKDQNFLKEVLLKDKNLNALKNIKDENFLKETALKSEDKEIRVKSIYFIESPKILKEILKNSKENDVIEITFLKLQNNPILIEILNEDFSEEKKMKALDYMDENTLKNILKENNFPYKRETLQNISDENFLMDYFNKTDDLNLKISALKNIRNENFLKKVFSEQKELKEYAILNINDEIFLKENYEKMDLSLKKKALSKIKDQEFLKSIFLKEKDETLKDTALKNIFDKDFLKGNYKNLKSRNLKKIVLNNLTREEQEFYKEISLKEKDLSVKADGLTFIEDNDFIKNVILKEESLYVKLKGLKRISKEDALKEIFEKEKIWFIKYLALKKIKDKKFLEGIKDESFIEELNKTKEIQGDVSYSEICLNLNEKYFNDLIILKDIVKNLGDSFSLNFKSSCKERRYFFEEENSYPPERGKVFQVSIEFEIINRSSNFYKKIKFSGRNLSKREYFDKNFGKLKGYYVKYYLPEIDFLDFTKEILKEFEKEKILNYLKSKNKYIKASALILKSEMEEK